MFKHEIAAVGCCYRGAQLEECGKIGSEDVYKGYAWALKQQSLVNRIGASSFNPYMIWHGDTQTYNTSRATK